LILLSNKKKKINKRKQRSATASKLQVQALRVLKKISTLQVYLISSSLSPATIANHVIVSNQTG
jgi:hypothetical protein